MFNALRSPLAMLKAMRDGRLGDGLVVGDENVTGPPYPVGIHAALFDLQSLDWQRREFNEQLIRAACQVAYLGENIALCRVLGRYKAYVDTTDIGLSSHLMLDGYWEMWLTELLHDLIRPGMVVADVGANVGYFTLLLADLVGPAGRVYAFEPNPRLAGLAGKSLSVNGYSSWASVHQTALGDRNDGSVMLVVPPLTPMNGYVLPLDADVPTDGVPMTVPATRLDSRADWCAIELAKIDVEGAEEVIWSGARGLLDSGSLRTVVLEFKANRYGNPVAFLERLGATGFAIQQLTFNKGLVATDIDIVLSQSDDDDIILVLRR